MTRGPYKLLHLLGRGSSGEVWSAERDDGRLVALKVLREAGRRAQFNEAIRRETRIGGFLTGLSGVVAVSRVEEVDGNLLLESEWVRGPNLEQVLAGRLASGGGPVPASIVVAWGVELLRTLDQVARRVAPQRPQSFLHRDIKPANLLLDPAGRVRITDFGIARAEAALGFQTTATGIVKGSPRFMAPELILDRNPDARADQFSVGAVLYELLSGRPLYAARDLVTIITLATTADATGALRELDVHPALSAVLGTMLARERTERYPSAREAATALASVPVAGPRPEDLVEELISGALGPEHPSRASSVETTMPLGFGVDTLHDHPGDEEETLISEPLSEPPQRTVDPDDEPTEHEARRPLRPPSGGDNESTELVAVRDLLDRLREDRTRH